MAENKSLNFWLWAGLFNENLIGAEDFELFLRISYMFNIDFLDKTLAKCCFRPNSLTDDSFMMDESVFYCLKNVIKIFPDSPHIIGKKNLNNKMFLSALDAAYCAISKKQWSESRYFLCECLKYNFKMKWLCLYFITFLSYLREKLFKKYF